MTDYKSSTASYRARNAALTYEIATDALAMGEDEIEINMNQLIIAFIPVLNSHIQRNIDEVKSLYNTSYKAQLEQLKVMPSIFVFSPLLTNFLDELNKLDLYAFITKTTQAEALLDLIETIQTMNAQINGYLRALSLKLSAG